MLRFEISVVGLCRACLLVTLAALGFGASVCRAQTGSAQVSGSIAYRERIALPPDAAIDVQLQDMSIADIASKVVAETMISAEGRQVPIPFVLTYDPAQINAGHRYSVRATIRSGDGMLMFSTTQAYPVITHGAPSKVNLLLHTVGHGGRPGASGKEPALPASEAASAEQSTQPPTTSEPQPSNAFPLEETPEKLPEYKAEAEEPQLQHEQVLDSATAPTGTPSAKQPEFQSTPIPAVSQGSQPEAKAVEPQPAQSTTSVAPPAPTPGQSEAPQTGAVITPPSEPELLKPEAKAAESQPAQPEAAKPEAKAAEPGPALPEAPSAVAKIAQPSAGTEPSDSIPEPDPESLPSKPVSVLADTQWKLIQLGGIEVVIAPPNRPLTLAFSPEGLRIAGSAGCNSYLGSFADDHGHLHLNPGGMTLMACSGSDTARQQKFIAALQSADGFRLSGDYLLLTSKGKVVAKFRNQFAQ